MNTPFQWTKQVASHFGGTRNPLVVSWPARIKDTGGMRSQFHHVIDIAPTILEAAGMPEPTCVNGVAQKPIEGVSMVYTFDDAKATGTPHARSTSRCSATAPSTTTAGSRPLPRPAAVGARGKPVDFDDDTWELYNIDEDFSEADDLAAKEPGEAAASCRSCSWRRPASTTCCRSTTAPTERAEPADRARA